MHLLNESLRQFHVFRVSIQVVLGVLHGVQLVDCEVVLGNLGELIEALANNWDDIQVDLHVCGAQVVGGLDFVVEVADLLVVLEGLRVLEFSDQGVHLIDFLGALRSYGLENLLLGLLLLPPLHLLLLLLLGIGLLFLLFSLGSFFLVFLGFLLLLLLLLHLFRLLPRLLSLLSQLLTIRRHLFLLSFALDHFDDLLVLLVVDFLLEFLEILSGNSIFALADFSLLFFLHKGLVLLSRHGVLVSIMHILLVQCVLLGVHVLLVVGELQDIIDLRIILRG